VPVRGELLHRKQLVTAERFTELLIDYLIDRWFAMHMPADPSGAGSGRDAGERQGGRAVCEPATIGYWALGH